jgi:transcriptional regulator with GAF, ATPase, and Fis domain/tRNA A-37 threonylcarbamoyl transferase component Bud32
MTHEGAGEVPAGGHRASFVDVALDLSRSLAADDRYRRLLSAVRRALPVDGAMLLVREGDWLRPIAVDGLQARAQRMRLPVGNPAVAGEVGARRPFRKVGRVSLLLAYDGVPDDQQSDGVLVGLPLFVGDEHVGALNLGARDPHAFDGVLDDDFMLYAALAAAALRTANLLDALERDNERQREVQKELEREARQRLAGALVGDSGMVRALRASIGAAAEHDGIVLLVGELGTGKETVARAIHAQSRRRRDAFVYCSCALQRVGGETLFGSQSRALLESIVATTEGVGKLELAHGGTLYLESADLLSLEVQAELAKLAYLMKERRHAGGNAFPDVRMILACADERTEKRLVPDLGLAIDGRIVMPRLRERRDDVVAIARHFLDEHARKSGTAPLELPAATRALLESYDWPGNVRELRNVVERGLATSRGPALEIEPSSLRPTQRVGGYSLTEKLGQGGMGEVWLARHELLSRPAAVKVIRTDQLGGDVQHVLRRFHREALATAQLQSQHTIAVYDFGTTPEGSFYYVMERLHGLDLDTVIEDHGPLPPERVVHLLMQACASLAEAHQAGLVHRDVKPANLFVCSRPEPDFLKVLDFGLVTTPASDDGAEEAARTAFPSSPDLTTLIKLTASNVCGTPAFVSPEAVAGQSLDGRSDLYSLGCSAYYALSGVLPFEADDGAEMMLQHLRARPRPLRDVAPDVTPDLEALIHCCLAKSPVRRPADAGALRRALRDVKIARWDEESARGWWRDRGE